MVCNEAGCGATKSQPPPVGEHEPSRKIVVGLDWNRLVIVGDPSIDKLFGRTVEFILSKADSLAFLGLPFCAHGLPPVRGRTDVAKASHTRIRMMS